MKWNPGIRSVYSLLAILKDIEETGRCGAKKIPTPQKGKRCRKIKHTMRKLGTR